MKPWKFAVIGVILTLIGFGIYLYVKNYPQEVKAEKISSEIGTYYQAQTPHRGWFETGVWVQPKQIVLAWAFERPFTLAIGDTQHEAVLKNSETSQFVAFLWTFPIGNSRQQIAEVDKQAKVYIYTDRPMTVAFMIKPMTSEVEAQAKKEAEPKLIDHLFSAVVGIIILAVIIAVAYYVMRRFERKEA